MNNTKKRALWKMGGNTKRKTVRIHTEHNKEHREISDYDTKLDKKINTQSMHERNNAMLSTENKIYRKKTIDKEKKKSLVEKDNKYIHARRTALTEIKKLKSQEEEDEIIQVKRSSTQNNLFSLSPRTRNVKHTKKNIFSRFFEKILSPKNKTRKTKIFASK